MDEHLLKSNSAPSESIPEDEDRSWESFVKKHFVEKEQKGQLIGILIGSWKMVPPIRSERAIQAMSRLLEEFPDSGARIIVFSMRNRKEIDDELAEIDPNREDLRLDGLRKCIGEWNEQANFSGPNNASDKSRSDSFSELIMGKPELRENEQNLISAKIQHVRRLRKGVDLDRSLLSFSDCLLGEAQELWESLEKKLGGIQESNLNPGESPMVAPLDQLGLSIRMQIMFNSARRANEDPEIIGELEHEISEYLEGTETGSAEQIWSTVYLWWINRIRYRSSIKRMDFEGARGFKTKMTELRGKYPNCSAYLGEMDNSHEKTCSCWVGDFNLARMGSRRGKCEECDKLFDKSIYSDLQKFHNGLCELMNGLKYTRYDEYYRPDMVFEFPYQYLPFSIKQRTEDKKSTRIIRNDKKKFTEKIKSLANDNKFTRTIERTSLYEGTELKDWKAHCFFDPSHRPVLRSRMGANSGLIGRAITSIKNAVILAQSIGRKDTHIAPSVLTLIAVELVVKIRWLLGTPRIHNYNPAGKRSNAHEWHEIRTKEENAISEEIRKEMAYAFRTIRTELKRCGADIPAGIVQDWGDSIENLRLSHLEVPEVGKNARKVTGPLGQLCDHCGSLLGWSWNSDQYAGREIPEYDEQILDLVDEVAGIEDSIRGLYKQMPGNERILEKGGNEAYERVSKYGTRIRGIEYSEYDRFLPESEEEEHDRLSVVLKEKKLEINRLIRERTYDLALFDSRGEERLRLSTLDDDRNPHFNPVGEHVGENLIH